jgi:hypothetical protein
MAFSACWPRLRRGVTSPRDTRDANDFSAAEVRRLLNTSEDPIDPARRQAVLAAAARPSAWTARLDASRAWELGRLAERLPTIVYLHTSGAAPEQVCKRLGTLSALTAERALEVACGCIAAQLNATRAAGVRFSEGGSSC